MSERSIVVVSDLHAGCRLALCPERIALQDGGVYRPQGLQKKLLKMWNEFWDVFVPSVAGPEYDVVVNGDLIEGAHHQSTSGISVNPMDQHTIAFALLEPVRKKAMDFYVIRGTPAHVGEQGCNEESLAKALGATPDRQGQYSRYELWIRAGRSLCHFNHHISTVGAPRGEAAGLSAELADCMTEAGRWGHEPPSVVVRSHRHRFCEVTMAGGYTAFTTAVWQLKTPYCYKVGAARNTTPQIGGSVIKVYEDGSTRTFHKVWHIERSREE